jgi:hypothetical protein
MQYYRRIAAAVIALTLFVSFQFVYAAPKDGNLTGVAALQAGLRAWTIQSINDLEPGPGGEVTAAVELDQVTYTLTLRPYSLRSEDFVLETQVESGELVEVEPPPPTTYRGEVSGVPGSRVAASIIDGKLDAAIVLDDDNVWFVEPYSKYEKTADRSEYLVYKGSDTIPTDYICGADLIGGPQHDDLDFGGMSTESTVTEMPGEGNYEPRAVESAEIAFDADWEYYGLNLYNLNWTVSDIEDVLNNVEVVYQRDVEICYNITHIIVRTTSNDPYTSNNSSTLLSQFRNEWNQNQGDIQRDVAHMMTGRDMTGNVIGIAYLSAICTSWSYGISQSKFSPFMSQRLSLTAHELGHNWSAEHCDGDGDCHIMCSAIGGCDGLGSPPIFGSAAISSITSYKSSRPCLDSGCGTTLDIIEPDPGEAGVMNVISVRGATPGEVVDFYYSIASGSTEAIGCPGVFLGLANARRYAQVTADSDGIATYTMTVPAGASGRTIYLQAVDTYNCELSDIEVYAFP